MVCLFKFCIIVTFTSIHSMVLCTFLSEIEVLKYLQKHGLMAINKENDPQIGTKLQV